MKYFKRNKDKEKEQWHLWFAWYPITVQITPDGDSKKVWLDFVYRCQTLGYGTDYYYEYKEIK